MGVCGSTYCSVLVNFSRASLVSKHIDTNLWQVDICMVWVSLRLSSLVSISTIVVCVISWFVSGKYCFRLVVQVFFPWYLVMVFIIAPSIYQIKSSQVCLSFNLWYRIPLQHLRGIILIGCCLRNPVYTTTGWDKAATPPLPPPPFFFSR